MAVAPVWTADAARAAGFPAGSTSVDSLFEKMFELGMCERLSGAEIQVAEDQPRSARVCYYMPDRISGQTVQSLTTEERRRAISHVAGRVSAQPASRLPDTLRRWSEVASDPFSAGRTLSHRISDLLQTRQLSEAWNWLETARFLGRFLPGDLAQWIALSRNLILMTERRTHDEAHLEGFLERKSQIEVFQQMLAGPDAEWGLHYYGTGGVGKTMLLRYLQARVLKDASSARVDFDYLNPDYPTKSPALMLQQLAGELAAFDRAGNAEKVFYEFRHQATRLQERLGVNERQQSPTPWLEPEFRDLLRSFAYCLDALPRPVVLFLDTCEELAKLQPDGSLPMSVEATFSTFEQLHALCPRVRVVFCGRRPLASKGPNWSVVTTHPAAAMPERPYLRLHQIWGFSRHEAQTYLSRPPELAPAAVSLILDRCRESTEHSPFAASAAPQGFNPFELSVLRHWAEEDPDFLQSVANTSARDPFVELRILARIRNPDLQALLPAVALLGRFTRHLLRDLCSDASEAGFQKAYQELGRQEWIDHEPGGVLAIPELLRERILRHLEQANPEAVQRGRNVAIVRLEKLTLTADFADIEVSTFECLYRLLRADPGRAARWWAGVEARIAGLDQYAWADNLCRRLLGAEEPSEGPTIRPAIRATLAAACLHQGQPVSILEQWQAVSAEVDRHPVSGMREDICLRAVCGQIAAARAPSDVKGLASIWDKVIMPPSGRPRDEQLNASVIGALEAEIERQEADARSGIEVPADSIHTFAQQIVGELGIFCLTLAARAAFLEGHLTLARRWFEAASARIRSTPEAKGTYLDWLPPADLAARVDLELVRFAHGRIETPARVRKLLRGHDQTRPINSIDTDRLTAAVLQLGEAERLDDAGFEPMMVAGSRTARSRETERRNCHRRFPPFFAAWAQHLAARGRAEAAMELLSAEQAASEAASVELAIVLEAARASASIGRQMRLQEGRDIALHGLESSTDWQDHAAVWEYRAFGPLRNPDWWKEAFLAPTSVPSAAWVHSLWMCTDAVDEEHRHGTIRMGRQYLSDGLLTGDFLTDLPLLVDRTELRLLEQRPFGKPRSKTEELGPLQSRRGLGNLRAAPLSTLSALQRAAALVGVAFNEVPLYPKLERRLGRRWAACAALSNGELVSLRLPRPANRLLEYAANRFQSLNDPVGCYLARMVLSQVAARLNDRHLMARQISKIERIADHASFPASPLLRQIHELQYKGVPKTADFVRVLSAIATTSPFWAPWISRYLLCRLYAQSGSVDAVGDLMGNLYSVRGDLRRALPVELTWLVPEGGLSRSLTPAANMPQESYVCRVFLEGRRPTWVLGDLKVHCLIQHGDRTELDVRLQVPGLVTTLPVVNLEAGLLKVPAHALIELDPFAVWPCWEGSLAWGGSPAPLSCTRRLRDVSVRPSDAASDVAASLPLFMCSLHWRSLLADIWVPLVHPEKRQPRFLNAEDVVGFEERETRLLHAVVICVETSDGVRLQLSDEGYEEATRRELVRAKDLCRALPGLQLCVLQSPPLLQGDRTLYESKQAAYLRIAGAELSKAGVPVVLTVPPLGPNLAVQAVALFLRGLRESDSPLPEAAVAVVTRTRSLLLERTPKDPQAVHPAWEVCLYVS